MKEISHSSRNIVVFIQSRLVYCKAPKGARLIYCKIRGAPTTATTGIKVSFQSKQWIGYHPNHSVAYAAMWGLGERSGLAINES